MGFDSNRRVAFRPPESENPRLREGFAIALLTSRKTGVLYGSIQCKLLIIIGAYSKVVPLDHGWHDQMEKRLANRFARMLLGLERSAYIASTARWRVGVLSSGSLKRCRATYGLPPRIRMSLRSRRVGRPHRAVRNQ